MQDVVERPTADGGRAELLTAERPFPACGKLTIDFQGNPIVAQGAMHVLITPQRQLRRLINS